MSAKPCRKGPRLTLYDCQMALHRQDYRHTHSKRYAKLTGKRGGMKWAQINHADHIGYSIEYL
jgi:hypothetical protein